MPPFLPYLDPAERPSPDEIAALLPELPASPNVLQRLCNLVHDEESSLQELHALLRLDPGMTARIFQSGNQLAATNGEICLSIDDAVSRLGAQRIAEIVSRVAKAQVFARQVNLYGFDADEFWRWSISCALSAELLAEVTGEDPDLAYTIGLLHACGIVAIDEWARENAPTLLFMSRDGLNDFLSSENELLGCTQAEVGAFLLQRWAIPSALVEPIRWQNEPERAARCARLASLLHAAKWLRTVVCLDDDFLAPPLPKDRILRTLHITAEQLGHLVVDVRIRLGRVRNLVEISAA